jgi:hypothetical protein
MPSENKTAAAHVANFAEAQGDLNRQQCASPGRAGRRTSTAQFSLYGLPVYLSSQLSITETQGSSGAVASSAYVVDTS